MLTEENQKEELSAARMQIIRSKPFFIQPDALIEDDSRQRTVLVVCQC